MLVAFEGLNGTGKTTLARAVAGLLDGEYVAVPPPDTKQLRDFFDEYPFDESAMLFYLSFVARLGEDARRRPADDLLIVDRYVASTLAYCGADGRDVDRLVGTLHIRPPDLTVLVTAEERVRRDRLAARPTLRAIDRATFDPGFRHRVLDHYAGYRPVIRVDQTAIDPAESAARTAERIRHELTTIQAVS